MAGGKHEQQANRGSREVVRAISHNLRTPLAVIKGCTDMLLTHELDEARRRELLMTTAANVDRLAEAVAWVEQNFADLAEEMTIRLPESSEEQDGV
jgi:K+-sensing histidine kinase KdpD